jgi:hypothetical protein
MFQSTLISANFIGPFGPRHDQVGQGDFLTHLDRRPGATRGGDGAKN